jgi:PI-3-kinase-related kinase SMG-1
MQTELYPRLIQDVQLMINELGNMTVLWEELWLSTLQDLHTGILVSLGAFVVHHVI